MRISNARIEEFLDALKADGRSSPNNWDQFYLFLKANRKAGKKDPPVPLILAASMESDATKHSRLADQLYWSSENDCLEEAIRYLQDIPNKDWNSSPLDQWEHDNYPRYHFGWTSDPKPKMNHETKSMLLKQLIAEWYKIAGPELSTITQPHRFAGTKGCRLLVFAKRDVSPPWGTWTMLDGDKNKRNFFTRLRAAVNAAIKPVEVHHIDFIEVDDIDVKAKKKA